MVFNKTKSHLIATLLLVILLLTPATSLFAATTAEDVITTRDLAMFSSIAYADLENIKSYALIPDSNINNINISEKRMVTDDELKAVKTSAQLTFLNLTGNGCLFKEQEQENTYDYLFYGLASTSEVNDWNLVNYFKCETLPIAIEGTALFTAMTFKRGNDIVIAYRGTDFDDIGDWTQDFFYGLAGYSGQEEIAQKYALAIAENFPNSNIYVTGHSLGGYLTQIGGAALLDSNYRNNVKQIIYFNGMGLLFWSNFKNVLNKYNIISDRLYNLLTDEKSFINKLPFEAVKTLTSWYNEGGCLIGYHINGDLVSALGTHCGDFIGFYPDAKCIAHHHGNVRSNLSVSAVKSFIALLTPFAFNYDLTPYVTAYRPQDILNYVWMTHETDSFFSALSQAPTVTFNMPSSVKYKNTVTATITINSGLSGLEDSTITPSDLAVSHPNRISVVAVSEPTISKDENNNIIYTYKVTIKGGIIIGYSSINIKSNVVHSGSGETTFGNTSLSSPSIRTKL